VPGCSSAESRVARHEDDLGNLGLQLVLIRSGCQQACHRGRGVGTHVPVARLGIRALFGVVKIVDDVRELRLTRHHVATVGAFFNTLEGGRGIVDNVDTREAQGGHRGDLDVTRREVRRLEQVNQMFGDVLTQRVVAGAVADQAQAVRSEGARAVGDLVRFDELAPLGLVLGQGDERLNRRFVSFVISSPWLNICISATRRKLA